MDELVSSSFVYPWLGSGKVKYPPGLTETVGVGWIRLQLVGDIAADVPPDTEVDTDIGWLLPSQMVGRSVKVKVKRPSVRYAVKGVPIIQEQYDFLQVKGLAPLEEGETQLDQTGPPLYGGTNTEPGGGLQTRPYTAPVFPGDAATILSDLTEEDTVPVSGTTWVPNITPKPPGSGNEGVFTQQFTQEEVEDLRAILQGGGGSGGGGGNTTLSYTNAGTTALIRGMAVSSVVGGQVTAALGNIVGRFVVGIFADNVSLPQGGSGNVIVSGDLVQSASDWEAVTGEPGGLVPGQKYYLNFTQPGMLTRDPDINAAPASSYLVSVGYAVNQSTFRLDIEPGIRLS